MIDLGATGFRTVEAEPSERFGVRINGEPLFWRGASLLPGRVEPDMPRPELEHTLRLARDAGMNMIRLPGIASYGSETLFDLCDELGIAVWQDFPFANMDYPIDDEAFEAAVREEISQFLAAAERHPSLSVLCGGSEVEQQVAMLGLDPELGRGRLFTEVIPTLIREHELDVPYVTSTPTGGDLPFRPNTGVAHYFGVGAYRRPLHDARRAEIGFAAECLAFANVPDDELLDGLAPDGAARLVHHPAWKTGVPRDVGTGWDFDDVRDHYLREVFGVDPVETRWADPDRYLDLSRAVTGEVMAEVFGDWRRARSGTHGALVWWLNDILPGAGWGVLDSTGRPKAAYWYLRRALAPTAVWMTDEGQQRRLRSRRERRPERPSRKTGDRHVSATVNCVWTRARPRSNCPRTRTSSCRPRGSSDGSWTSATPTDSGRPGHDLVTASLLTVDGELLSRAVLFPQGRPVARERIQLLGLTATVRPAAEGLIVTSRYRQDGLRRVHRGSGVPFPRTTGSQCRQERSREIVVVPDASGAEWGGGSIRALNATGVVRLPKEPTIVGQ